MAFYFRPFPRFRYANTAAINLTTKLNISAVAKKSTATYFTYSIKEGERADHLAKHYYEDPTLSWLLYLANDVVDPYYEWPLNQNDFTAHMIKKYGSLEKAQEKILFWKVNWSGNESFLTATAYAALTTGQKKYWKPVFGEGNTIRGYDRKSVDWISETNQIVTIRFDSFTGTAELDDVIHQGAAQGQLAQIDEVAGLLTLKHINGSFNDLDDLTTNSGATFQVTEIVSVHQSLPTNEASYWIPVTAFDYENELNDSRRNINVIDRGFIPQIEKEIAELFA